MERKLFNAYMLIIILSLMLPNMAFTQPPADRPPVPVNVTNFPNVQRVEVTNQPFCPCFTPEEVDNAISTWSYESITCDDIRDQKFRVPQTNINLITSDGGSDDIARVYLIPSTSEWTCRLIRYDDGFADNYVHFYNIGLTNAMACRQTLMNSNTWAENCE